MRPPASGPMSGTSGHGAAATHLRHGTGSRPTGEVSIPQHIWSAIEAGCMRMATPGSTSCTVPAASRKSPAWRTSGASSLTSFQSQGLQIAENAIRRIAGLYAVEKEARGLPPDERAQLRQERAKPILDDLETWLAAQLTRVPGKSELAKAIRYALTRITKLRPYLNHGHLEIDNNPAERAMKPVAIGRKNYLFVGSEGGGKAAAVAYTCIETAKLKRHRPASLADLGAQTYRRSEDHAPRRSHALATHRIRSVTLHTPPGRLHRTDTKGLLSEL